MYSILQCEDNFLVTFLLTLLKVSVSVALWCVMVTRTVRMVWMREAVA